MELIKQIKQAETTAKKLLEDAQKNAVISIENAGKQHAERLNQALQERRKKIEQAQAEGLKQGTCESEKLNAKYSQTKQQLEEKAGARMETAVNAVVEFIKKQN